MKKVISILQQLKDALSHVHKPKASLLPPFYTTKVNFYMEL